MLVIAPLACAAMCVFASDVAHADEISWQPCPQSPDTQCGSLEVPRDYAAPDGDTIELHMARHRASDPEQRIGTLFFNPGGPGEGAAGYVSQALKETFSPALRKHFDIIGIDPRGVAGSEHINCDVNVDNPEVTMYPHSKAEYGAMVRHNAAVGESCDGLIKNVDTKSVAKDFDAVRAALNESAISFLGKSYGSILGTQYAQLYPDRIRTMTLDGTVDHSMSSHDLVIQASAAVERSFNDFAKWCSDTTSCALHDKDATKIWDTLVDTAQDHPIPVKDGHAMTKEELIFCVYGMLNLTPEYGVELSKSIAQAAAGDASGFVPIRDSNQGNSPMRSAYRSILCSDIDPQISSYTALKHRLKEAEQVAPHMRGVSEFWDMTAGCKDWPVQPSNPQRDIDINDAPPILLVGNTGDPATPVAWAKQLSNKISGSQVLTVHSSGHTAYGRSKCATTNIDDYLVSRTMPEKGAVCQPGSRSYG